MTENKTLFIKPNHLGNSTPKLDAEIVKLNKSKNIETTLVLDNNVLVKMERVVKDGNEWSSVKKHCLDNLVELLKDCPPYSICLSPAFALNEMPPQNAQSAKDAYELFCAKHLPNFVDTPNSTTHSYSGKNENYGFDDLALRTQKVLSIPYLNFLYLNYIYKFFNGSPIEKFKAYVDLLDQKVDLLSATEIEIAKYCFCDLTKITDEDAKRLVKDIRNNSVKIEKKRPKPPENLAEFQKVAFNAACDIHLLHAANAMDGKFLDGVKQDCWVTTLDKKLASFSNFFHQLSIDGELQPYSVSAAPEMIQDQEYWNLAHEYFSLKSLSRRKHHLSRSIDFDKLLSTIDDAILQITQAFENSKINNIYK
jgi:hypothetical protein